MKLKLLNLGLIITSLFGYLEWGQEQAKFLFEIEWEILRELWRDPISVLHPLTILPMVGQLLLIISLLKRNTSKALIYIGMTCIGILILLICFIGIINGNYKILLSSLPFLICAMATVVYLRKRENLSDTVNK